MTPEQERRIKELYSHSLKSYRNAANEQAQRDADIRSYVILDMAYIFDVDLTHVYWDSY